MHGRNAERGAKTVRDIENAGGKARFVAADVSDADDVRRLADEAGDVDILVNNAGIYRFAPTFETSRRRLRRPDQHQPAGAVHPGAEAGSRHDRARPRLGGQRDAPSRRSTPAAGAGIYGASKAALELLTKLWADEFGAPACGSTPSPPDRRRRRAPRTVDRDSSRGSAAPRHWAARPRPTRSPTR